MSAPTSTPQRRRRRDPPARSTTPRRESRRRHARPPRRRDASCRHLPPRSASAGARTTTSPPRPPDRAHGRSTSSAARAAHAPSRAAATATPPHSPHPATRARRARVARVPHRRVSPLGSSVQLDPKDAAGSKLFRLRATTFERRLPRRPATLLVTADRLTRCPPISPAGHRCDKALRSPDLARGDPVRRREGAVAAGRTAGTIRASSTSGHGLANAKHASRGPVLHHRPAHPRTRLGAIDQRRAAPRRNRRPRVTPLRTRSAAARAPD